MKNKYRGLLIGDVLKEIRLSKKLTQEQVAGLADIKQSTLSVVENNVQRPSGATLNKLCKLYKIDKKELLSSNDKVTKQVIMAQLDGFSVFNLKKVIDYINLIKMAEKGKNKHETCKTERVRNRF